MYKSIYLSKILLVRGSFHSSGLSKDSVFRLFSPAFHRNRPFHALWKELSSFPNLDFLPSFYLREEKLLEDYSIYSFNFNDSILLYIRDRYEYLTIFIDNNREEILHRLPHTRSRISCYEKIFQVIAERFVSTLLPCLLSLTSSTCAHEPWADKSSYFVSSLVHVYRAVWSRGMRLVAIYSAREAFRSFGESRIRSCERPPPPRDSCVRSFVPALRLMI